MHWHVVVVAAVAAATNDVVFCFGWTACDPAADTDAGTEDIADHKISALVKTATKHCAIRLDRIEFFGKPKWILGVF